MKITMPEHSRNPSRADHRCNKQMRKEQHVGIWSRPALRSDRIRLSVPEENVAKRLEEKRLRDELGYYDLDLDET